MTSRKLVWTDQAWEDYVHWQTVDRRTLLRINLLLADMMRRDPFVGIGKPEPLKHALSGAWSRRIDGANRLVYLADADAITIIQARYRY